MKIIWIVNNPSIEVPEEVQLLNVQNRKRLIYEMDTAKVWVFDYSMRFPDVVKRLGQIFINVKHWSSITLKTFGVELSKFQKRQGEIDGISHSSKMIDYFIVGSKFDEITCRRGFEYNGDVFMAGSPRSNILFSPMKAIKKFMHSILLMMKCLYAYTLLRFV